MPGMYRGRQSTARYCQPVQCAILGCGEMAVPGGIYCRECRELVSESLEDSVESDIEILLFSEKVAGEGPITLLLERYGAHPCGLCGGPALPGRQYCSERCRVRARMGDRSEVKIDGIVASVLEHAERLGLNRSTVYKRLRVGLSPIEALKKPIDLEMRRRALCCR